MQVDDDDAYDEVHVPEQNGSRRRFWQFNDSRPEPEPLLQPSRKQRSPKRRSSSQQPKEVDMSANSLSSGLAEPTPLQTATKEAALVKGEGTEAPYTTPDGWTVINDSLIDSAAQKAEEDLLPRPRSWENGGLRNGSKRSLEGAQEAGSSKGAKHSKRESPERSNAKPEADSSGKEQLPGDAAGAIAVAPDSLPSTVKQAGADQVTPSYKQFYRLSISCRCRQQEQHTNACAHNHALLLPCNDSLPHPLQTSGMKREATRWLT